MRDWDKFLSDLDAWVCRRDASPQAPPPSADLARLLSRLLVDLPEALRADLLRGFEERLEASGPELASTWLGGVSGLLSGEGGGEGLSAADWSEIGEIVSANAEEMDLDRLTEIMGKVLEHGGI